MPEVMLCVNCSVNITHDDPDDVVWVNKERRTSDYPGYDGDPACQECAPLFPEWFDPNVRTR
jgi:hypothetical protein